MVKKTNALLLCVILFLLLVAGCGSDANSINNTSEPVNTESADNSIDQFSSELDMIQPVQSEKTEEEDSVNDEKYVCMIFRYGNKITKETMNDWCSQCGIDFSSYNDYRYYNGAPPTELLLNDVPDVGWDAILIDEKIQGVDEYVSSVQELFPDTKIIVKGFDKSAKNRIDKNGILVVSYRVGDQYVYNTTGTFKCTAFTIDLDLIDSITGEQTHYKTFSSEESHSCSAVIVGIGGNTTETKRCFSDDYTKLTATLTTQDGATHVGWCDENGRFTDVSEKITVTNDFSGIVNHTSPCFFGRYLYFRDSTDSNVQIKRVPINSLSPSSVEIMADGTQWNGVLVYPLADGSVIDAPTSLLEYYDSNMSYVANANFITDWINEAECIGADDGMIYRYWLDGEITGIQWYSKQSPLLPYVKNRFNWSAVLSPDGNQIAFLSRLTAGNDTTSGLYLTSIEEENPTKVNTTYTFPGDFSRSSRLIVGLLDWW